MGKANSVCFAVIIFTLPLFLRVEFQGIDFWALVYVINLLSYLT